MSGPCKDESHKGIKRWREYRWKRNGHRLTLPEEWGAKTIRLEKSLPVY